MDDGEVNNEFDIIFPPSLSTRGHDADEHSPNPTRAPKTSRLTADTHTHTHTHTHTLSKRGVGETAATKGLVY